MSINSDKKECPYCSEKILTTAKKCRYCGEWLEKNEPKQTIDKNITKGNTRVIELKDKNINRLISLWVITLIIFLLMTYLIKGDFSTAPTIYTIFLLFDVFCGAGLFIALLSKIMESWKKCKNIITPLIYSTLAGLFLFGFFGLVYANTNKETIKTLPQKNPTPTLTYNQQIDNILSQVNQYRKDNNKATLLADQETCSIAWRLSKTGLENGLKIEDHRDLCPNCSNLGGAQAKDIDQSQLLSKWKEDKTTNNNLLGNYTYGCAAINEQVTLFIISSKYTKAIQTNNTNTQKTNSNGQIECIGPDGKHFNTTMDECKKLNEAWSKPVDYMLNCNIHTDCGGGTVYMAKSECDKPCSGRSTTNAQTTNTTTKNSGTSYFCYDNVNKYSYYTTSGEQCNLDNAKSLCLNSIKIVIYEPCMDKCLKAAGDQSSYCIYNLPESQRDDCLAKKDEEHKKCMDICGDTRLTEAKKCY